VTFISILYFSTVPIQQYAPECATINDITLYNVKDSGISYLSIYYLYNYAVSSHHHLAIMELGHLLTHSILTHPEAVVVC
jgi:hypothetical protein